MELGGEFCLVCGSPPPLFGQRICEACFRERLQLVKIQKTSIGQGALDARSLKLTNLG